MAAAGHKEFGIRLVLNNVTSERNMSKVTGKKTTLSIKLLTAKY
jgi:hypothetical protein